MIIDIFLDMTQQHEYAYLAPDANKLERVLLTPEMVKSVNNGTVKRHLFEEVDYDLFERQKIKELRRLLEKNGFEAYSDVMLLKFLYLSNFDQDEFLARVEIYQEWMHNPLIQGTNKRAESILRRGVLYSYGRDYEFRPVVIFRASEIDLQQHPVEDYYWALNSLMKPIESAMLVPGKVEKVVVIIDISGKSLLLPIASDYRKIISKVATAFMQRAQRIILINAGCLVNLFYKSFKSQIEAETSPIMMLSTSQLYQIRQFISPNQLEQKYSGNRENLIKFWPIQVTNEEVMTKRNRMKEQFGDRDESSFESLFVEQQDNLLIKEKGCCWGCIHF